MSKIKLNILDFIDLGRNISSAISLIIIFVLSLAVALYTLQAYNNLVKSLPDSKIININKRINAQPQ